MRKNRVRLAHAGSVGGLFLLVSVLMLGLVACTNTTATPPADAKSIIKKAQDAVNKVKSYHFTLKTENMGKGRPDAILVKDADGDVGVPDKLKADAKALAFGFSVETQIIAVDDQEYYTDPITGQWVKTKGLMNPRDLSDPEIGVAAILGKLQNTSQPKDASVNGKSCWSIDGKLEAKYLSAITGGTPRSNTVDTTVCIGKDDSLPYQIRLTGVAIESDKENTARTFTLSDFDKPVEIKAPSEKV